MRLRRCSQVGDESFAAVELRGIIDIDVEISQLPGFAATQIWRRLFQIVWEFDWTLILSSAFELRARLYTPTLFLNTPSCLFPALMPMDFFLKGSMTARLRRCGSGLAGFSTVTKDR